MFDKILILLIAILPSIFFGLYIYKKDIIEKEPKGLLLKLFIFGILSSGIALLFEDINTRIISFVPNKSILYALLNSFFVIALSEEISKWFFTYHYSWRSKEFNYVYDGIVYASFVAIGFATIENVLAAISSNADLSTIVVRGIITVPLHIFMGIISGYHLGLSKQYKSRGWNIKMRRPFILSIVIPTLIHGLFDYLVLLSTRNGTLLCILLIILLYYLCFAIIAKISKDNKKIVGNI